MAHGVYRTEDEWVQVSYGRRHWFEISRKIYEERGYQPIYELLPLENDSDAVKAKLERIAAGG
jgi:hypothetical protein